MTLAERQAILEQSRYDGNSTIGRSLFTSGVVNPMIDSAVIRAAAKDNPLTFMAAFKNGGFYNNNTIMGGNFIAGSSPLDYIPGVKALKGNATEGKKLFSLGNWSMNYIPESAMDASGISKEAIKKYGIENADHVMESGIGFSRNYGDFFGLLKNQGLEGKTLDVVKEVEVAQAVDTVSASRTHGTKQVGKLTRKAGGSGRREVVKTGKRASAVTNSNVVEEVAKNVTTEKTIITKDMQKVLDGKNTDEIRSFFRNHYSTLKTSELKQTADALGKVTGKSVIVDDVAKSSIRLSKRANLVFNAKGGVNLSSVKGFVNSLDKNTYKALASELGVDNISVTASTISNIKNSSIISKIASGTYNSALVDNLTDATVNKFFVKTGFEKFMSSTPVKIMTGNLVSGALSIPLAIATGTASALASNHQSTAINNFSTLVNFKSSSLLDSDSDEAIYSNSNHQRASYENDQYLNHFTSNRNIAEKYMSEIDQVDINVKHASLSDFTVL